MLLVRGMQDGRSVLAVKMHHSAGDGVSALGLLDRMLDNGPDGDRPNHPSTSETGRRPLDPARTVSGLWSLASRGRPPRHPMNRQPVGAGRQFVPVRLPAAPLRAAARALGAHPHELALAAIADAIGRLLGPRGLVNQGLPLRAMVPIAMRPPRLDRIFGNWTGSVALDLPLDPSRSVAERVHAVRGEFRRRQHSGEPQAGQLVLRLGGALPSGVHRRAARSIYNRRFFNTLISYMPGPRTPRWCAGVP